MRKKFITICFASISVLLLLSQALLSQEINGNAGVAGAQFLRMNMGARAVAMGGAYCAVSDEINAVFSNPAGLAQLEGRELGCHYNRYYENIENESAVLAIKLKNKATLAVGGVYLHMDDMIGMEWDKTERPDFTAYDLTGLLSYAVKMGKKDDNNGLMIGVNAKFIQQSIDDEYEEPATGFAGDLGVMFKAGGFSVGAAVQNVGTEMTFIEEAYKLPMNIKSGLSYVIDGENRILVSAEVNIPMYNSMYYCFGGEYTMKQLFSIRCGYNTGNDLFLGYTLGAGLMSGGFSLDYAWVPGSIGDAHRVSVNFKF